MAYRLTRRACCTARQLRDRISLDNWHTVQRLAHAHEPAQDLEAALAILDQVLPACTALAGYSFDDMTRDDAWRFLVTGRRLERMAFISSMVAQVLARPEEEREAALGALLEIGNIIITYRARYQRQPELLPVLDLLVKDESNPHAVCFQLALVSRELPRVRSSTGISSGQQSPVPAPIPRRSTSPSSTTIVRSMRARTIRRGPRHVAQGVRALRPRALRRVVPALLRACGRAPASERCGMSTGSVRCYRLEHRTIYRYSEPVTLSHQQLHLTPRPLVYQRSPAHEVTITPAPTYRRERTDAFGNPVTEIAIESAHSTLEIVSFVVEVARRELPEADGTTPWEAVREALAIEPAGVPTRWLLKRRSSCSNRPMHG